ncbi:antitermination protein [Enterobacteriaceae bacterium 4M9]|nr:antitermination protein [Enterobacteriaceae bacterium 4M9]
MRLEAIGKYFAPKSPMLSDSPRATACDSLDISGVMAALGIANAQCGLGIELYLAKIGVSAPDKAVLGVYEIAKRLAGRTNAFDGLQEDIKQRVLQILATFAFQDYSRSAASVRKCDCCNGEGFIDVEVFSIKTYTPTKEKRFAKAALLMGDKEIIPSAYQVYREQRGIEKAQCPACKGKKVLSNACRCHGKGMVVDQDKTKESGGAPVWKTCDKCSGRRYRRLKFSIVFEGVQTAWDVKKTFAYDHLQPFFESLAIECHKEEAFADSVIAKVTR